MPDPGQIPFDDGFLPVSDGHRLYYAQYGSPQGPVSIVLHGGPGSGCSKSMLDWFDLEHRRVVLSDQRGAGRSIPTGETAHNTTADLVQDIERLRCHLGVRSWLVIGGSWGATLALCYAGTYPDVVSGLVLRGTFLASPREIRWFFQSLQALVPMAWRELTAGWSQEMRNDVLRTLTGMLQSERSGIRQDAAQRWGRYEEAVMTAMMGKPPSQAPPATDAWLQKYRLQAHYLSQGCFTSERALFRNARLASNIRTIVLHGTHDWICPPQNAERLIRFLPNAEMRWIEDGTHSASDPLILAALKNAISEVS